MELRYLRPSKYAENLFCFSINLVIKSKQLLSVKSEYLCAVETVEIQSNIKSVTLLKSWVLLHPNHKPQRFTRFDYLHCIFVFDFHIIFDFHIFVQISSNANNAQQL